MDTLTRLEQTIAARLASDDAASSYVAQLHARGLPVIARKLGEEAVEAIVAALAEQGFVIVLAGRDAAKAQALLDEIDPDGEHHATDLAHFSDATDFTFDDRSGCLDLIVNASSLGMIGQPPLDLDLSSLPADVVVYDLVYAPLETDLLAQANDRGLEVVDGLEMLVAQAAVAFELLFGIEPPRERDDEREPREARRAGVTVE